jgi:6-pyruvoyltetrahydropterin/6-carboxytetrahydropterin synthase
MEETVRLSKEIDFEMAHALRGYDGLCSSIHGHSYKMVVTVKGIPLADESGNRDGMIIDFSDLKQLLMNCIVKNYDHALVLHEKDDILGLEKNQYKGKLIRTKFQPTCENLVSYFASVIRKNLPKKVLLSSVRLYETNTSYCEWLNSDNQ